MFGYESGGVSAITDRHPKLPLPAAVLPIVSRILFPEGRSHGPTVRADTRRPRLPRPRPRPPASPSVTAAAAQDPGVGQGEPVTEFQLRPRLRRREVLN